MTQISVYVAKDFVYEFLINEDNFRQTLLLQAIQNNAQIVDVSELPDLPSVGMNYNGATFSIGNNGETFKSDDIKNQNVAKFVFVNDGKVVAEQYFHYQMADRVAAFQSNPTFVIS
jgi:hypothetical protein